MDWNDLRYVAAVAESGSTIAAAQRLRVSQPTVGRRIAALETALGLKLFDRLASGYRLTRSAEALLPAIAEMEKAAQAVAAAANQQRRRLTGTVRLAAPGVIAELYVALALTRFRARYPDIQVEILASDTPVDVERGEADVAIQVGARPGQGRLIVRRLATDVMTLFCSRSYAATHGVPSSVEALRGHVLLVGTGPFGAAPVFAWLQQVAPDAQIGYPASNASAHVASVRAGAGIGVMPRRLFGEDPELVACFDAPAGMAVETWLVARENLRDDPAVRSLLNFIGDYRGASPSAFRSQAGDKG
jgi:DNA-binding transcriptional LysR family regulator